MPAACERAVGDQTITHFFYFFLSLSFVQTFSKGENEIRKGNSQEEKEV